MTRGAWEPGAGVCVRAAQGAALAACVLIGACGGGGKSAVGAEKPAEPVTPMRGLVSGLGTQTWIVNDTTGEIGRALAAYAGRALPARAEQVRVWRAGGLRIVAVPEGELERLRDSLSLVGPQQQRWSGELVTWTPIVAGVAWRGERKLSIGTGADLRGREVLKLPEGRMRLLARAYALPTLVEGKLESRMTIELVPQHEEPEGSARALTRQLHGAGDAEQRGLLFRRMALEFVAVPGECYLITGEAPELEWVSDAERSSDSPGPEMTGEGRGEGAPTLGEALLTGVEAEGMSRARVIVVLMPRTPRAFTLTDR